MINLQHTLVCPNRKNLADLPIVYGGQVVILKVLLHVECHVILYMAGSVISNYSSDRDC